VAAEAAGHAEGADVPPRESQDGEERERIVQEELVD
jgi:hypothetical protein